MTHKFSPKQMAKLDNPQRYRILPPEEVVREIDLEQGLHLADIGCGIGYFTFPLAQALGKKGVVFGLDVSPEMLEEAQKRYVSRKDSEMAVVEFLRSEEAGFPLESETIDIAFVANVLHEIDDQQGFLKEVARVLKSSGRLVIVEWAKEVMDFGPPVEERLSQEEVINSLESASFKLLTAKRVGEGHYMVITERNLD